MQDLNIDLETSRVIAVRTGKTVYRSGEYVVKVFDEDYSKSDILNEALNQARVEETGLRIPRIVEVARIRGKWAIVMEYVAGETLANLMAKNKDKSEEYLERFVDLQAEVHSQRASLLNNLRTKMMRKISETSLDATSRYELHMRVESMPNYNSICHGDFSPSNIICCEDGVDCILDWSHVTQGDPCADIARTYLLFWLNGEIEMAERYMQLFCKKHGYGRLDIQKWLPIVAASQLVKGKPEEREFLHYWADVADYE